MDLTGYPIKMYHSKRMAERIQDEVLNDYSEKKGEKLIPPIITDVLADCIGGIKKPLDLADLEQKVNNLRNGTMEEQAIYLCFRKQLIDYDCMPINENGKPYDLSVMFISKFNVDRFLDELCLDNPELLDKVLHFYQKNRTIQEIDNADFISCLNKTKTELPAAYAQLYNYLTEKEFIPKSSMLPAINLTKEQFAFLVHYDKAIADEGARTPLMPAIIDYATKNLQGTGTIDDINRTIAAMRYGSIDEQAIYNKFCKIVRGLPIMPAETRPTVQEQREKLLRTAKAMEPASVQNA